MMAFAYITTGGEIDIQTVSPTALAAQVNAIIKATNGAVMPFRSHTEDQIGAMFRDLLGQAGTVERVTVRPYQ